MQQQGVPRRSRYHRWRTPESTLHLLAFLGGWPERPRNWAADFGQLATSVNGAAGIEVAN